MLIKELLQRLDQGEKMADVAAELGVHKTTIIKKIRAAGYTYNRKAARWEWDHDHDEPVIELADAPTLKTGTGSGSNQDEITNDPMDELDHLINRDPETVDKLQRGFYFDPEVIQAIDTNIKDGYKSRFVNAAVKRVLQAKGLMK